jgi:hypothetical protein
MMPAKLLAGTVPVLPDTVAQFAHLGGQFFPRHCVKVGVHAIRLQRHRLAFHPSFHSKRSSML